MPRTGPGPEVSHHMLLPRRCASVSSRPTRAARISPGAWGRHTYVSESSTSTIGRPSAVFSITRRADSTSGSSGMTRPSIVVCVTDLEAAWARLQPDQPDLGADLLARWREPHRHYHTDEHLAFMLEIIDRHADLADDADAVRLAAWFHDAVYDPRAADNEE